MSELYESHFSQFASQVIGNGDEFISGSGEPRLQIYADWAATGKAYQHIEEEMWGLLPSLANTHTEASHTGKKMTEAYHAARETIKQHAGANEDDVLVLAGSGMTGALAHFQSILGWRIPEQFVDQVHVEAEDRPLVIVSHAEHHSNDTSWREQNMADTILAPYDHYGIIDLVALRGLLHQHKDRRTKVVAVTAASNVTGIRTPINDIAEIAHEAGGRIFVDGTCAMPYDDIKMHPSDKASIDALYFSPHKFLGGQGTPGVLLFNKELYGRRQVPVRPGGGTVLWTNPWGGRRYYSNETVEGIEAREDGGTPPFMGAIRAAKALRLKEKMGIHNIAVREAEITDQVFDELGGAPGVHILGAHGDRLPIFPIIVPGMHYNAVTTLLSDRFGIQVRGGCSCAGTYGHQLMGIGPERSRNITDEIDHGDIAAKPGYTRASLHPTMSPKQVTDITQAFKKVARKGPQWLTEYVCDQKTMQFNHKNTVVL